MPWPWAPASRFPSRDRFCREKLWMGAPLGKAGALEERVVATPGLPDHRRPHPRAPEDDLRADRERTADAERARREDDRPAAASACGVDCRLDRPSVVARAV